MSRARASRLQSSAQCHARRNRFERNKGVDKEEEEGY